MCNNEINSKKSIIKEATIEELMRWQETCQGDYRSNQGIINTDGLIIENPPYYYFSEIELPEESELNSWRHHR